MTAPRTTRKGSPKTYVQTENREDRVARIVLPRQAPSVGKRTLPKSLGGAWAALLDAKPSRVPAMLAIRGQRLDRFCSCVQKQCALPRSVGPIDV